MPSWVICEGYFYTGSPRVEGTDTSEDEFRRRRTHQEEVIRIRHLGPPVALLARAKGWEEAETLIGVQEMMAVLFGLKDYKLVYQTGQKRELSREVQEGMSPKQVLSCLRKWKCKADYDQLDFDRTNAAARAIMVGRKVNLGYVRYAEWCKCTNHH